MRKQKDRLESPAIAESFCQLKLNSRTGVWPTGAQERTRWGRSLNPLSSIKIMVRLSLRAFF
jgi:hypothetical protein